MTTLAAFVAAELDRALPPEIAAAAERLAAELDGCAVLFYGSVLRTGDLDGVLDFYVLTDGQRRRGLRGLANRWLWPDVSYHEFAIAGRTIRAKVATMPLATFTAAAGGRFLDTTIWTRFVQPAVLAWSSNAEAAEAVRAGVAAAVVTAARFAAALGPERGPARDYWRALFAATYRTELRVERPGREGQIIGHAPARFDMLLPLAWEAAGLAFEHDRETLIPRLAAADRRRLLAAWRRRRRAGKPLNLARLAKAAFTFDGAARYALWKVERHTGLHVPLTPWRERHPILAAPGVLWRVWRTAGQR
ncbi:MAG TPA: hypothetical protein VFT56_04930 [Sphingomonas sp.]|nr:hypothetical protein [Sphingomonas sp.]